MTQDEKDKSKRQFLKKSLGTAGLLAAGGSIGWWIQKTLGKKDLPAPVKTGTKAKQAYDLEPFTKFDPKYELYREEKGFETGLTDVSRMGLSKDGMIWVAGESQIVGFSVDGTEKNAIDLGQMPTCIAFSPFAEICCALTDHVVGYDLTGSIRFKTKPFGAKSVITGMAVTQDEIFVADAGQRLIFVCDREGKVIRQWGKKDEKHPGFVIPSPYFPLRVDSAGQVVVANTGRLRLETYLLDGTFQTSWGQPGMGVDAFCGCCNPVYFDFLPNGDFITSEKGLVRIHRYRQDGTFVGVVAGPEQLWQGMRPESKLSGKGKMGDPFDIVVGVGETVYALDPHRRSVRIFVPKETGA